MSDSGPLTQAGALALLRRTTDKGWLDGMLAQPDGAAIIASKTAIAEAASLTIQEQVDTTIISTAPAGCPGRCALIAVRAPGAAFGVPQGTKFVTSSGVELEVAADIPIALNQTSIVLPLQTLRQIDLVNTVDPAFDDVLTAGAVLDPILSQENDPDVRAFLAALSYVSSSPIVEAKMDWLSVHGNERGCYRQPNEDGEAYRLRVRTIPDAVTPVAIAEAVHGAQSQGELPPVYMVEPCRDQSSDAARGAINLLFADSVFCDDGFCDDALGVDIAGKGPFRTCETPSLREGRAYFRLSVEGSLFAPDGLGLFCDYGFCDDDKWGYPDVGLHPDLIAGLRGIQEEARVKKAGGVQFDTYVESAKVLSTTGTATSTTGIVAFTLLPDSPADSWLIREGSLSCDAPDGHGLDPSVDPMFDHVTDAYKVRFTLLDGSTVESPWSSDMGGMPLRTFELERIGYFGQPVTKIEGLVKSATNIALHLVGTFWTTPMQLLPPTS